MKGLKVSERGEKLEEEATKVGRLTLVKNGSAKGIKG